MKKIVWYHGGTTVQDWAYYRWDRDRTTSDGNQEGPGMYWTTDLEEAQRYIADENGALYTGAMKDGFRLLPKRPSLGILMKLYQEADEEYQQAWLSNWDIELPASYKEIEVIMKKYNSQSSMLDAAVTLFHDLFRFNANEYVRALQAIGFDGAVVARGTTGGSRRRQHLILWNIRAMDMRVF